MLDDQLFDIFKGNPGLSDPVCVDDLLQRANANLEKRGAQGPRWEREEFVDWFVEASQRIEKEYDRNPADRRQLKRFRNTERKRRKILEKTPARRTIARPAMIKATQPRA